MAVFGVTHLVYQTGDKLNPRGASHPPDGGINVGAGLPPSLQEQQETLRCSDTGKVSQQRPLPFSADLHHGSHERYKEMVRRVKTPRSPSQLYTVPLTDNQQYGWLMSRSPEPWTQVKRFPDRTVR